MYNLKYNNKFFIIGEKIYATDFIEEGQSEKEQVVSVSVALREKILELKDELERQTGKIEKEKEAQTV